MRCARYRRRYRDQLALVLTGAEAVEVLALVLGVTLTETDLERRCALAFLSARVAAVLR